jgi:hypothetical protein
MPAATPGDHVVEPLVQNLSAHPIVVIAIILVGLLALYFLFRQLLKLALLSLLIVLAVGGYFYFKDPDQMPRNMMETLEKAKTETGRAVETGKEAYFKGKKVAETGREAYSKGKAIAEKGKRLVEGMDNLQIGKDGKADPSTEGGEGDKGQK